MVKARQVFQLKKTGEAKFISRKNNNADKAGADPATEILQFLPKVCLNPESVGGAGPAGSLSSWATKGIQRLGPQLDQKKASL